LINPHPIERESFEIIRSELGDHQLTEQQLTVAVRVIHATADFDFLDILRFSPDAIEAGIDALRRGAPVLTDVHMTEAGISDNMLSKLGGSKLCAIRTPAVREAAEKNGTTRSTMAMRLHAETINGGIVAIGNAPTALLEVCRLVREENIRPALVVGMPVGFVSAVESKDELTTLDVPYITAVGRKGGSPVAASTMNALLRLAVAE
jgi:precorrin-8X/cobalt-precorrin-8 methylmutase